jgi:hypothetical protein
MAALIHALRAALCDGQGEPGSACRASPGPDRRRILRSQRHRVRRTGARPRGSADAGARGARRPAARPIAWPAHHGQRLIQRARHAVAGRGTRALAGDHARRGDRCGAPAPGGRAHPGKDQPSRDRTGADGGEPLDRRREESARPRSPGRWVVVRIGCCRGDGDRGRLAGQ